MTHPANLGTIQIGLVLNTLLLIGSYWLFQWMYGTDPLTHAYKQDTEKARAGESAFQ